MKTERNIFLAFILNLAFSVFEFIGGVLQVVLPLFRMPFTILEMLQASVPHSFLKRKAKNNPMKNIPMATLDIL